MGLYQLPMGLYQADYEKAALTSNWLEFLKEKNAVVKYTESKHYYRIREITAE